ncbi:hypothetical protein [Paenibacillus agaridevorans]|uniref:hypothetical protein n=1 Tax=Paenibacillus agaridevorans TaxID=171404 RepID=UPI001BE43D9D|nr:hypothetical protein [Paenibacillus agaridevorans]
MAEHELSMTSGENDLMILPVRIDGDELMRLYSVTLIPLAGWEVDGNKFIEIDATDVGN